MMTFAPLALILLPLAAAVVSFALPERLSAWRNAANLGVACVKLVVVTYLLMQAEAGLVFEWRYEFLPGHDFVLRLDPLALLFVTLSVFLWLLTTIYAIAYFDRVRTCRASSAFSTSACWRRPAWRCRAPRSPFSCSTNS